MSDNITVRVKTVGGVTVQSQEIGAVTTATNVSNPSFTQRVADIGDVDASNLQNGSVLVYKTTTSKWTSTTTLDLQNMEGGEY